MHRHAPSEVYHVLEGEFAFYMGRSDGSVQRIPVRAGQVMPLRGGTMHTIRNESDSEAVAFVVHSPGIAMERFSRAAVALAAEGPRPWTGSSPSPSSTGSSCSDQPLKGSGRTRPRHDEDGFTDQQLRSVPVNAASWPGNTRPGGGRAHGWGSSVFDGSRWAA